MAKHLLAELAFWLGITLMTTGIWFWAGWPFAVGFLGVLFIMIAIGLTQDPN